MVFIEEDPHTDEVINKTEIDTVSSEEMAEFSKLFCRCEEPDPNPKYVEHYHGVNHGWICHKCRKFVQIG